MEKLLTSPSLMIQRTQLYQKLTTLSNFRFSSYLKRLSLDSHLIRFYLTDEQALKHGFYQNYIDLLIIEANGSLMAFLPLNPTRLEILT